MRLRESVRQRLSGPWAAALLHGAIFGLVLSMWDVHDGRRWVATLTKTGIVAAGFVAYMWLLVYRRQVIDAIVRSGAINTFIPALAYSFSSNPTEVGVKHEERHAGVSNYSFYMLIRLNFDLITGFSLAPLQYFTMFSGLCAAGSFLMVLVLAYRRLFLGAEAEGLFTLFGILFFLLSVCMVGIGLIGEYVGRTYQVVRARQRYFVREILETA